MGSQIPSHHTDVATAMGTGDSFLCDGGGKRLKFEKLFIQPTPLKVCTCNCAKSSKTAATSPMIKPPKNCAFSLCATSRRTGKCLRLSGNRRPIHLPSCSVNFLQTQLNDIVCSPSLSHTKFRAVPVDALGNPLAFTLMAANVADISAAKPLIAQAPKMPLLRIVYAQERLTGICIKPEICSSAFNWIKHFRCVATRFKTLDLHDATIVRSPVFVMPRLIGNTTWYSCPFHPVRRNFYCFIQALVSRMVSLDNSPSQRSIGHPYGPGGEIGRRRGLKIPRRKACRFDSDPGHQPYPVKLSGVFKYYTFTSFAPQFRVVSSVSRAADSSSDGHRFEPYTTHQPISPQRHFENKTIT